MILRHSLLLVIFSLFNFASVLYAQQGNAPIALEDITKGTFYPRSAGYDFVPSQEEGLYTILSENRKKIEQYSFSTGEKVKTLLNLDQISSSPESLNTGIEAYKIAPGGENILIFVGKQYIYRRSWKAIAYLYNTKDATLKRISSTNNGKIMNATFSPNGDKLAFVEDNNIYLLEVESGKIHTVTTDGKVNHVINGAVDWVYEEEFYGINTLTFSPDGLYLAYVRFDESQVATYGFQIYTSQNKNSLPSYQYKYPFAGEENSQVEVHLYNISKATNKKIDLPFDKEDYIPRISFSPYKNELLVFRLNRHQNNLKLYAVDPLTHTSKITLEETDKAYISNEWINSLIIEKNGFIMVSDIDGYAHIYRYDSRGHRIAQLTKGEFDVKKLYGVDDKGSVYYQAAQKSPISRQVFVTNEKGESRLIAGERGINDASFSKNFTYMLLVRSHADMPPIYTVASTKTGKTIRTLEDNNKLQRTLAKYRFHKKEFTKFKTPEGIEFNAFILKPSNFDSTKQYPVLMTQYSGPDSQEVLDQYDINWTYALVEEGFIVISVDGRGTGSRGAEWRKCTYLQLGILESEDQIASARVIGKLPYVDASRIGIWGWSFGGYNTLLSMCRSKGVFKAGIAIAPVSDWHFYDTVYTERFLGTPKENPQGYANGSPLKLAKDFNGKLLLIHGTADDNVHLRNALLFSEELVQAGIPFEMAVYNNRNHSIYGGNTRHHLYKKSIDFLKRNL